MLSRTSYGQYLKYKLLERELIEDGDHLRLRPTIARQLHTLQQNRDRKVIRELRQRNLNDVWKYYQKLMSQPKTYPILPSFPVFLELPAVKMLQSRDLSKSKITVKSAVKDKSFLSKAIKDQIVQWVEETKRGLLPTLGPIEGSAEWDWDEMAPARRVPHPVLRLDAWWRCKACDSVDNVYSINDCLDFNGVCRHQCKGRDGKEKLGVANQPWSARNFVKDEQACAVVKACLERLSVADRVVDGAPVEMKEAWWFCKSCDPPILVHARSLLGHSHRHEIPITVEPVSGVEFLGITPEPTEPTPFGHAYWMMQHKVKTVKKWINKTNYACQHCHNGASCTEPGSAPIAAATSSPVAKESFENKFSFNGLRCHLKSKHKICKIRDEDFYYYKPVSDFPGARTYTME